MLFVSNFGSTNLLSYTKTHYVITEFVKGTITFKLTHASVYQDRVRQ